MESDLNSAFGTIKSYLSKYDQFVKLNPRVAAEVEAIIRWSSYLVATRKSPILGELLSSGANLLQLCNDIILRQAQPQLKLNLSSCATQLRACLSVIQSLELLAEIYARDTYGNAGKWAIITTIQIAKATIRIILLLVFDDGISKTQSIVPLDRGHYSEILKLQEKFPSCTDSECDELRERQPRSSSESRSMVLKSSGRRMRSITESPPRGSRFADTLNATETPGPFNKLQEQRLKLLLYRYREHRSATLTERQLYGEMLHITRPIVHLAMMGAFGTKSWLSYFTSVAMDIYSLHLVRSPSFPDDGALLDHNIDHQRYQFNINERLELSQRASSLLLYLLRSPFFDEYTKQRALDGLAMTAESIPIFGHFLATFVNYIPEWQKDYFRVWSG